MAVVFKYIAIQKGHTLQERVNTINPSPNYPSNTYPDAPKDVTAFVIQIQATGNSLKL